MTVRTPYLDESLVPAKFAPPRVGARHVLRKTLLARLREQQHCTVTLITGSAGFGKTILLVQWRQELMKAGAEVAWLGLAPEDGSKPAFRRCLLGALGRLGIDVEDEVPLGDEDGERSNQHIVASIVAGVQRTTKDLYLLIDDYQHVDDPQAHQLLQKLISHSPGNLHIVIASRVSPPLSLSRLRVYGQVAAADVEDLSFTLDETQAFFEQNLSATKLTADELRLIQEMTHGWPGSLHLIAIMLRSRTSAREQLRTFLSRSRDLQTYLAEDVIAQSPPELIALLETLSLFRRFNAALAEHVSASRAAPDVLRRAEEEYLLIQRVESDERAPWYRFHPLLGEFLSARLAQRGEDAVQMLHRRGSEWFCERQMPVDAVRHATLGGDLAFAVRIVEQATPADWSFDIVGAMVHLLEHLPPEELATHPRLLFLGCLTYALTARPAQAQHWLEPLRRTQPANPADLAVPLALAEAAIATQRDDSERVIALLERPPEAWPANRTLRYVYLGALATAYARVGRLRDAHRLLAENRIPPEDQGSEIALLFEATLPAVHLMQGAVRETVRLGAVLLQQAEASYGRHSVCANQYAAMLGDAYYELDRIADAREVLANRTGVLRSSWPDVMVQASLCHARLDRLERDPYAAVAFLEAQAAHFSDLDLPRPAALMFDEAIRMLLAEGDHVRAQSIVARLNTLVGTLRDTHCAGREIAAIAAVSRARVALVNFDASAALAALDEARAFARTSGRARMLVSVDLLAAAAHVSFDQQDAARQCVLDALKTAAELGLVRTCADDAERIVPLLASLRDAPILTAEVAAFLDSVLDKLASSSATSVHNAQLNDEALAVKGVHLTPREREILLLISQAMSNKRIALTLNITVGTTKWNVRNILTKLGVSTRYDAMIWAREQGFIK